MWPPGWMTQKQLEKMYEKCTTNSTSNGQTGDSKNTAPITTTASKPNPPPTSSQAHGAPISIHFTDFAFLKVFENLQNFSVYV